MRRGGEERKRRGREKGMKTKRRRGRKESAEEKNRAAACGCVRWAARSSAITVMRHWSTCRNRRACRTDP